MYFLSSVLVISAVLVLQVQCDMKDDVATILKHVDFLMKKGRLDYEKQIYLAQYEAFKTVKSKDARICVRHIVRTELAKEESILEDALKEFNKKLDPILDIIRDSDFATEEEWDDVRQFLNSYNKAEPENALQSALQSKSNISYRQTLVNKMKSCGN